MSGLRTEQRLSAALKALTAYYNDHVEDGDPPCPCTACKLARDVFAAELKAVRQEVRRA